MSLVVFTYSGDPAVVLADGTPLDMIRFKLGDIDKNEPQVGDPEIIALYADEGSVEGTVAACCEALATRYSKECDQETNPIVRSSLSQKARAYADRAKLWRQRAIDAGRASEVPMPHLGGMSLSRSGAEKADTDNPSPAFTRDLFDQEVGTE